jgi:pilus assembly protein Flp/PilA
LPTLCREIVGAACLAPGFWETPKTGVRPGAGKEGIMRRLFHRFIDDQSGVTAIEYSLIAGLISIVIITSVGIIGTTISNLFFGPIAAAF